VDFFDDCVPVCDDKRSVWIFDDFVCVLRECRFLDDGVCVCDDKKSVLDF